MTIDTNSEEHRHRCEVRWCLTNGSEWFKTYIAGVAQARGKAAAERLRADVRAQFAAGNRGGEGEWKETSPHQQP